MRHKKAIDFKYKLLRKYKDKRGFLIEFVKPSQLSHNRFVQFFCATIEPGQFRGNHYHCTKDEWLILIEGKTRLILEDVFTKDHKELILDASKERIPIIKIGAYVAHLLENMSKRNAIIIGYLERIPGTKYIDRWEYKKYKFSKR